MKFPIEQRFKLSESFLEKYKTATPPFGFNGLGEMVYMRTYSRVLENGSNEAWWQTIKRVVEGIYSIQKQHIEDYDLGWNQAKAQHSAQEMYDRMFNMKLLPAGRSLWAMGTPLVMDKGVTAALFNCSFLSTKNIKEDVGLVFSNAMDFLMVGIGVGADTQGKDLVQIKHPKENKETFVIPDSREGWVESVYLVINSFFGGKNYEFDYSEIRPEGAPIKTFGGTSSGYKPLKEVHDSISETLTKNIGNLLSERNIVDIFNFIGKCVVAGNVRRSAEIMIGEPTEDFLNLKNYELNPERESFGWASNNTVYAKLGDDYSKYIDRIAYNGEPGFLWLDNAKAYGRLMDGATYKDNRVAGVNPCGEITLESGELCNLVETVPANHDTLEDFQSTLKYAYLFAKTITLLGTQWTNTNRVMLRNRRLGVSMTGIVQSIQKHGIEKFKNWITTGYETAKYYDKVYSDWLAIPESIKLTTVKPSGCGVASTLVATDRGILNFSEMNPSSSDKDWKDLPPTYIKDEHGKNKQADKFYTNGIKEVAYILTNNGVVSGFTYDHKLKVLKEDGSIDWVKVLDLKKGDLLPYRLGEYNKETEPDFINYKNINMLGMAHREPIIQPIKMNSEIAWFVGYFYRAGSVYKDGIKINDFYKNIKHLDKISDILKSNFDADTKTYTINNGNKSTNLYVSSLELQCWLGMNGLLKSNDQDEMQVPSIIRKSSKKSILAFIDGFLSPDESPKSSYSFVTSSKKFAETMTIVMRFVGIDAKSREFYSQEFIGKKKRYRVSVKEARDEYKNIKNIYPNGDFGVDVVEAIERGVDKTFDISVPDGHMYLANGGYISHNTLSLVSGSTSGMHYPESQYYIRRVRIATNSPLLKSLKNAGYNIEPAFGQEDTTSVIEFPVYVGNVRTLSDVTMWEQLELASFLQTYWADNSVSVTVTFKPEEAKDISNALNFYQYKLKAVSFLPKLETGSYKQMPYEEITKERYEEMLSKITQLDFSSMASQESDGEKYCTNDICTI